jgi:membrane protein implicated in regulation of membrane protease activity
VSAGQNFGIIFLFTILSVVRSYLVRRYFNQRLKKLAQSLAEMTH